MLSFEKRKTEGGIWTRIAIHYSQSSTDALDQLGHQVVKLRDNFYNTILCH